MEVVEWHDKTAESLKWFRAALERVQRSGPAPLGIHLLMGSTAPAKLKNVARSLEEERVAVVQAVSSVNAAGPSTMR